MNVEKPKNKFGGQVGNRREDFNPSTNLKRSFEKKHLKSFLRGDQRFSFGRNTDGTIAWYPVLRAA